jgi:hypothetical protein
MGEMSKVGWLSMPSEPIPSFPMPAAIFNFQNPSFFP